MGRLLLLGNNKQKKGLPHRKTVSAPGMIAILVSAGFQRFVSPKSSKGDAGRV
jgi:hypothetical protein